MTQLGERRIIEGDFKRIVLDLPEWELIAPSEGIYDEPTVYYKANLRWAKLIEGFVSHLAQITAWKEAEDENFSGIQAILTFLERVEVPFVFPEEGGCNNFLPSAAFVAFYPQNPYNQPDYIPDDLLAPPFFVNNELEYPEALGYKATDVFIDPASINIDPIDLITLNLPRIEITVKGAGQLEIDFLAVQSGSTAIVKIGSMPNIGDIITGGIIEDGVTIVDLNNDSISIPPERDVVVSEEINIEAEENEITIVYIVFMPVINDALIPLALGGGIRQIGLCAFEDAEGGACVEAVRFNQENCSFEQRVLGEWEVIEGNEFIAECIGAAMSIDYEALKQAIREAGYAVVNDVSKQIVSGVTSGFSVGEDGTVTIGSGIDGGENLPEDDPATPIDETESAIYGGSTERLRAIEKLLDRCDTLFGTPNGGAGVVPIATAQEQIKLMFPCDDAAMDAAMSDYYSYRQTENIIQYTPVANDYLNFYCLGYDLFAWNNWLLLYSGFNAFKISTCAKLVAALSSEFWSKYFESGAKKPSNAYLNAACVPMPYQELLNVPYASTRNLLPSLAKGSHRLLIQVGGYYNDPDGDLQDPFWYRTNLGVLARSNFTFVNGAGANMPSDNQVVYNTNHAYEYTIDLDAGNNSWSVTFNRNAGMNAASTSPTNGFYIKITDLGLYTV